MKTADFIRNRFTLTLGGLALAVLLWNLYVAANDNGRLIGHVTTADGLPVAGATVVLARKTVTSVEPVSNTLTDAHGRFAFYHHDQYAVVLSARKPGVGSAQRRTVQLWFRNQNRDLAHALVLEP